MLLVWVMKNIFKSLLNLIKFKEKTIHMTISELKTFNIREKKLKRKENSGLTFQKLTKDIKI